MPTLTTSQELARIDEALREERRRLADALHDDALQLLAVARQDLLELLEGPDADRAEDVLRSLDRGIAAVRSVVRGSHEDALAHVGLGAAVADAVDPAARRGQLTVSCVVEDLDLAVPDLALVLSAVRELCANVASHAGARHAEVAVHREDGAVVVIVEDDGRGIAEGARERSARDGHLGLVRLAGQVARRAGTLEVDSTPGAGTRVVLRLPA